MMVFAITIQMAIRSSHQRCTVRKGVLRNFAKFTGKHLYQVLFFNKVAGSDPCSGDIEKNEMIKSIMKT